jgi:predicted lipoprotein with Yx(FWY)xxD motif
MLAGATVSAAVLTVSGPAGTAGASHSHPQTVHVATAKVPHVGTVLTNDHGLTLYWFEKDPTGKATCTGVCAKIWPPYLAAKGAHVDGPRGVKGLAVIDVGSGHWQVAFHDHALYRFESDKKKGHAKGQGFAGVWFAALKSGIPAMHAAPPAAAPASPTTQPPATPTTQAPATTTTPAPAPTIPATPATAPPTTTPVTAPPPPMMTTTTLPPTTTTTSGGGGYGY